jgi:hypothetical protein
MNNSVADWGAPECKFPSLHLVHGSIEVAWNLLRVEIELGASSIDAAESYTTEPVVSQAIRESVIVFSWLAKFCPSARQLGSRRRSFPDSNN